MYVAPKGRAIFTESEAERVSARSKQLDLFNKIYFMDTYTAFVERSDVVERSNIFERSDSSWTVPFVLRSFAAAWRYTFHAAPKGHSIFRTVNPQAWNNCCVCSNEQRP